MNNKQKAMLEAKSRLGETVYFKDKATGEPIRWGIVEDEVFIIVGEYKQMIQRIKFADKVCWDGSKFGYRTCYYTFDKTGKKLLYGQFAQFLTEKEYKSLLKKARDKGWPI